jgi:hypothetical protein
MMFVPSGSTDRLFHFVAVNSTDLTTRLTGLTSFTVWRKQEGVAAVAYTTPTLVEIDSTHLPGVYSLALDEALNLASGHDTEEVILHITQASMAPVTAKLMLHRPKLTEGQTATASGGNVNGAVQTIAASAITATSIAADAITAAKIADAAIDAATFAAGAITATAIATDAIDAAKISAAAGSKLADIFWRRTYANARTSAFGDAVAFRSGLGMMGKMVNKWSISGSVLTICQEDDATATAPGGTQTVTGTAGADPITSLDT